MLVRLQCDKFVTNGKQRPAIEFHEGLNSILGDEDRSNSIGKSTLMMILDFVFWGEDYIKKCEDVQKNVLEHTINFTFIFDGEEYHFTRNTIDYMHVIKCDKNYISIEGAEKMHTDDLRDFLAEKYAVNTEGFSWRGSMSKFSRVYKRETMDEERPLQAAKQENVKEAIKKYMQQFGRYYIVDAQIKQANRAADERDAFKKTQQYDHIRAAKNQTEYDENEKRATQLELQEQPLAENSSRDLLDLDSMQAQKLIELNDLLISYRRHSARGQTQLNSLRREMTEGKKSYKKTFTELEKFFPSEEFKALSDVEQFHQSFAKVLTLEFKETERDLATTYIMLGNEIVRIKEQIAEVQSIPNVTPAVLKEYEKITTKLNNVREANKNFKIYERLKSTAAEYASTRDEVIASQLLEIQRIINERMKAITTRIVKNDVQRPPTFNLEKLGKYSFSTKDDAGSGAQFGGLITFDLTNMEVSGIPFVVHDSDLLDPIEKPALTEIICEYDAVKVRGQQVLYLSDR